MDFRTQALIPYGIDECREAYTACSTVFTVGSFTAQKTQKAFLKINERNKTKSWTVNKKFAAGSRHNFGSFKGVSLVSVCPSLWMMLIW